MNLRQTLCSALVAITLCVAGSSTAQAFYRTLSGYYMGGDNTQIVVTDDNSRNPRAFQIDQTVRITLNGRPVGIEQLLPGDQVRVAIASGAKVKIVQASRPWR